MKVIAKRLLIFFPLTLILLGGIGYGVYYIYNDNLKKQVVVDLRISTIGDSLTDGGNYNKTYGYGEKWSFGYQINMYDYLKTRDLESTIYNVGISGQIVSQICARFNVTVPADYIISMAGTNDLWRANYGNPWIAGNLSQWIIGNYTQTIFNTIKYQTDLGFDSPIIIICSIPPVGDVPGLPTKMAETIALVNADLKAWVIGLNRLDVVFCDVNRAMRNSSVYMMEGLYSDGVHFTHNGNAVCGEAIAQVITDHYYQH